MALEFSRPRENIGLQHPEDPNVWCVVRAGHEIAVVYDSSKNSVTFLNSKGVFSLRHVSAELASWAQAAEHVLPFTGATLMRHLTLAVYPHSTPSVQNDRSIEHDDDDEFELFVGVEEGAGVDKSADERSDAHGRRKSEPAPVKARTSLASSDSSHSLSHYFPSQASSHQAGLASQDRTTDRVPRFISFALDSAKALYHESGDRVFAPSRDGAGDEELVELQLHDNEIVLVKVWRLVCLLLCMHLILRTSASITRSTRCIWFP